MGALNVMKQVGYEWQTLTDEKKHYFQSKADIDKERYVKEMGEFYDEVQRIGDRKVNEQFDEMVEKQSDVKNDSDGEAELLQSEADEVQDNNNNDTPPPVIDQEDEADKVQPQQVAQEYNKFPTPTQQAANLSMFGLMQQTETPLKRQKQDHHEQTPLASSIFNPG